MRNEELTSFRIVDLWTFKSTKSHKRYIVELEYIDENFYAIKFYYKAVEKSELRYKLLTNDYEPRTIIRSCVEVIIEFLKDNPRTSFGFIASDDVEEVIKTKRINPETGNRRFRLYRRLMLNMFGPETFYQVSDIDHNIYLLLNKKEFDEGRIDLQELEEKINLTFEQEYRLYSTHRE